jgi:sugar lactone lactonase YvrE
MPDTQAVAIERVGDLRCTVGESPAWNAADHAWYWVDIPAKKIWRLDAASGALRSWSTPEMAACIAFERSGGLIAGMETGIFSLALGDGDTVEARRLAAPPADELTPEMRFNDGRCDRQGRFWAGTMFRDMAAARPDGRLYRYDGQGLSQAVVSELITQNGLAFSPDGRTMYLSDSHPTRRRVWAFDYDIADGVPHNRRLFVDMAGYAGRPDGAAVDADGCYWVAGNDGGCLMRFTPQGDLDRTIGLPMAKPSMCCFGGAGLDTMLVTSIDPGNGAGQGGDNRLAGAVLLLRPGVAGVAETPFSG